MKIFLSPQRSDESLEIQKSGDRITVNGVVYDFSAIPEGATLPKEAVECDFIAGPVERIDGVINVYIRLPIGPDASSAARYPEPTIAADGEVRLPK